MMASKTFSGQLDQAMDELAAEGNKILFIPQQNVGEVLEGAASEMTVESDGTYSIKLAYNTYSIYHYSDVTKRKRLLADGIVVSSETSVTTIPGLIGSTVPVTEDSVLTIQGYLDEANDAKTDAETAQAATEALYEDFNSNVAGAMALVHTETPSLSVPFNESGRLDYGVATEYVSGLPVYGVDFARSTTSTVVNKSGVLETLSADEMGIGSGGAWLHSAYNNYLNSTIDSSMNNTTSSNITLTTDLSPNKSDYWVELYTNTLSYVDVYSGAAFSDGDIVTVSVFVKNTSDKIEVGGYYNISTLDTTFSGITFDPSTGYVDSTSGAIYGYKVVSYGDFYRVSVSLEYLDDNSSQDSVIARLRLSDSSDTAVLFGVNVTSSATMLPYIDTASTETSASATTCTLPVNGNLPATGKSCTWIVDTDVTETGESNRTLIAISGASTSGNFTGIVLNSSGSLVFRSGSNGAGDVGVGGISNNSSYIDGESNRFTFVYDSDDETVIAYVNGNPNAIGSVSVSGMSFSSDGNISIGSSSGAWQLNAQLKNLKILPYAATADEVKSWGAPK